MPKMRRKIQTEDAEDYGFLTQRPFNLSNSNDGVDVSSLSALRTLYT
jgi:hypothetical protein